MKEYQLYTARDFATDEAFQEWVLHPDLKNTYFWETWSREYPQKQETIREAIALVRSAGFRSYQLTEGEKDQLWDAVWDKMHAEEMEGSDEPALTGKRHSWWNVWKYAAAMVIGIIAMFGIWRLTGYQPEKTASFSIHTGSGEVRRITLPDSSEVMLNANSRLVYSEKNNEAREVWLEGEAYFHVRHTFDDKAFIIHTYNDLSVEVLGTRFNVNSLGKHIAVVLQEGSIRLGISEEATGNKTQLYLKPGEMVRYDKQDGNYTKSRVDASRFISWTKGHIMMTDYTLKDAALFMRQVFDKNLVIHDSHLLERKISGSMPIVYNEDTMLVQFEKVFQVHFHKQEDKIEVEADKHQP